MKKRIRKNKSNLDTNVYSESVIKSRRTLPKRNIIILLIIVVIQIAILTFALLYEEKPIDAIEKYDITVTPRSDGSLDIKYDVVWRAISGSEPLSWVDIGIPNSDAALYTASVSDTVESAEVVETGGGGSYVRLYFNEEYKGGETVSFAFEINQTKMLARKDGTYLFEFVPGWFNEIPVESYRILWRADDGEIAKPDGAIREGDYYVWEGSLQPGEYRLVRVEYRKERFDGESTVKYEPFDDSGVHNDLMDKGSVFAIACCIILPLIVVQVYLVDSFVSYYRGRGFISEHGHPIHTYGRTNPAYTAAAALHNATYGRYHPHHGHGGGRSCACACVCACACAGGGRAGCSVKDGVRFERKA